MQHNNLKKAIPEKINLRLGIFFIAIDAAYFFIVPLLAHSNAWWLLLILPAVVTTNSQWSLIHEAIHSIFHRNKTINLWFGRTIALGLGIEFHIARFGHLMHHRFNRKSIDLTEGYDPQRSSKWWAGLRYYLQICIGLYLAEIFGSLLSLLPRVLIIKCLKQLRGDSVEFLQAFNAVLLKPAALRKIRQNTVVLILLWGLSFYLYGHLSWLLILSSALRGFLISFADNLPHYDTNIHDVDYAYNLSLPSLCQKWILNFNLHRVHHRYPYVPWKLLPQQFCDTKDNFDLNYFTQGLRQWRGVITLEKLSRYPSTAALPVTEQQIQTKENE